MSAERPGESGLSDSAPDVRSSVEVSKPAPAVEPEAAGDAAGARSDVKVDHDEGATEDHSTHGTSGNGGDAPNGGGPPPGPGAPAAFVDLAGVDAPFGPPEVPRRRLRAPRPGRPTRTRPTEGRWVGYRARYIAPMSVFKIAGLFYICLWMTLLVAGVVLWNVGRSTETIDQFEAFITRLGAYGECVPEDELRPGTDFERDDDCPDGSVLVDGFRFDDGTLFRASMVGGLVLVVGGTLATVLVTMLYNLLSEVTGGVRYTAIREPRSPLRRSQPPLKRR